MAKLRYLVTVTLDLADVANHEAAFTAFQEEASSMGLVVDVSQATAFNLWEFIFNQVSTDVKPASDFFIAPLAVAADTE